MNVQVIWSGEDITEHVIEYTRQHDICTGIGSLDIIIEGETNFNFNPWNQITVKENDTQIAIYNISSVEKTAPNGTYIIAAQDNSKRLTDYFIDVEYVSEDLSNTRYWIELILSDAGIVDYDINVVGEGEPVTIGSQFGMQSAYDSILNLLQLSGWYMYFDSTGSCQIGELDTNPNLYETFNDTQVLYIRTTYNDKMLRNRVYVWGSFDEATQTWIHATAETYLGWFRDDSVDYRSIVYSNSSIYYSASALEIAEKILSTFSQERPEIELTVEGLHNHAVGTYVQCNSNFIYFIGQVTSCIVNVNSEGATTTFIIDKKCPRLFGYSDIKGEYVYLGTDNHGVWRKSINSGYWYAYNYGIEDRHITDLSAYDVLLGTVTDQGELYTTNTGSWVKYNVPTSGLIDASTNLPLTLTSGNIVNIAACSIDRSYGTTGGINTAFNVTVGSGIIASGINNYRAWVAGLDTGNTERYMHQINCLDAGYLTYNITVLDLETNDLGQNIISVQMQATGIYTVGSFGNYTQNPNSTYIVGRNIYNALPPPTDGLFIDPADWGGQTNASVTTSFGVNVSSPVGTDMAWWHINVSYNHIKIYEGYLIPGDEYVEDMYDIELTPEQFESFGTTYKIIKVSDTDYHFLCGYSWNAEEGLGELLWSIDKIGLTVTKIAEIRNKTIQEEYPDIISYHGDDGDYLVISKTSYINGYIRVINCRTGSYNDYDMYTPPLPTNPRPEEEDNPWQIYEGWKLNSLGWDETPNHVIMAHVIMLHMTAVWEDLEPYFYFWVLVTDKYTGYTQFRQQRVVPDTGGIYEKWNMYSNPYFYWDFPTDSFEGQHDHRPSFVRAMYENITTGNGYVFLHIPILTSVNRWLLSQFYWPYLPNPWWQTYGTYLQSFVYYISLPGCDISLYSATEDGYWGNSTTDPVIPPGYIFSTSSWLLAPATYRGHGHYTDRDTTIHATYSRKLSSPPIVFELMRDSPETSDQYTALAFNGPTQILTLTEDFLYGIDTDDFTTSLIRYVAGMTDALDDNIYITTSFTETFWYGEDTNDAILGYNINGILEKIYSTSKNGIHDPYNGWTRHPTVLGDKLYADNTWKGFKFWPGTGGILDEETRYKILFHDPVPASGQFTVIFEYNHPLAVEVGMGLPTVIYDPPIDSTTSTTILATNYTNSGEFNLDYPISNILNARLFDVWDTGFFSISGGLPTSDFRRYIGTSTGDNKVLVYETEFTSSGYVTLTTFSGGITKFVDFTNLYPSPYVFVAVETTASGDVFYQRNTNGKVFYPYSNNLPVGDKITIIRADDRI